MGEWIKEMWYTHTHTHTHTHTQWNITQSQKEGNPAICENTEEPRGHYAKLNKSYRERQTLYDIQSEKEKTSCLYTNRESISGTRSGVCNVS